MSAARHRGAAAGTGFFFVTEADRRRRMGGMAGAALHAARKRVAGHRTREGRTIDYVKGSLRAGALTVVGERRVFSVERRGAMWLCGSQSRKSHDGGYLMAGWPCRNPKRILLETYGFIPSSRNF